MTHNKDRAEEPEQFIQMLNAVDDFYGQPFLLLDWQLKILRDVYGTVTDKGYRQYRFAYLEIPKKNGKTSLIAALSLYHITLDPPGGQIYCCAADRKQAELVYNAAVGMIDQNEDLQQILKVTDSKKEIKNNITGTVMKVLSAEAYTKHGINPTVVIFDELHAQPNRNLWDVMTFGAGAARKEPLWWVITTAGDDPDRHSIGWETHEYARKIQDGEIIDPSWYVKIYGAPEDADIYDEKIWHDVNPSLGKTISIESVRQEALTAKNNEAVEKNFRWLRLNQWVALKRIGWLPLTLWDATQGEWDPKELIGKKCFGGLDLSSVSDLTAFVLLFPPQEGIEDWRVTFYAWIPEDNIAERVKSGIPYDKWVREEFLNATPGNAVDYDFVFSKIMECNSLYNIEMLGFDPWNSAMLIQKLEKEGVNVVEIQQNMAMLSPAMKETERLMRKKKYTHRSHPVARWCFGNVNIAMDGNGNIKPMKNKSLEKIDITAAQIIAMAVAVKLGATKESIYETRGVRTV